MGFKAEDRVAGEYLDSEKVALILVHESFGDTFSTASSPWARFHGRPSSLSSNPRSLPSMNTRSQGRVVDCSEIRRSIYTDLMQPVEPVLTRIVVGTLAMKPVTSEGKSVGQD